MTDSCATLCLLSTEWVGAPVHMCFVRCVCVCVCLSLSLESSHAHEQPSQELLIIKEELRAEERE